jgi:hypothetical protein
VVLLTEKPNRTELLRVDNNYDEGLTYDMKDRLLKATAIPKAKNTFPATSNQEVGWDADLVKYKQPRYRPTWNHSKPSCAETKYASNYITMTGKSPYSSKITSMSPPKK